MAGGILIIKSSAENMILQLTVFLAANSTFCKLNASCLTTCTYCLIGNFITACSLARAPV
jgi:hypothetical protein